MRRVRPGPARLRVGGSFALDGGGVGRGEGVAVAGRAEGGAGEADGEPEGRSRSRGDGRGAACKEEGRSEHETGAQGSGYA